MLKVCMRMSQLLPKAVKLQNMVVTLEASLMYLPGNVHQSAHPGQRRASG